MPLRLPQRLEQSTYGSVVLSIIHFLGISECNSKYKPCLYSWSYIHWFCYFIFIYITHNSIIFLFIYTSVFSFTFHGTELVDPWYSDTYSPFLIYFFYWTHDTLFLIYILSLLTGLLLWIIHYHQIMNIHVHQCVSSLFFIHNSPICRL